MFPFWEPVVAPVLEAAGARRVVEVGALRGDTTRQVVERLGADGVLHVIDPVPGFDPVEHERDLPGRYVFHQGLSLDVLGGLPPMDAALLDGDHNWYTVTGELALLDETARAHGVALPVLALHDVGWPYGRRDLYYDPGTIPPEHRQPHRRAGMRPGRAELLPEGQGMSQGMWNAEVEGGSRNGVMTALEDFVAGSDRDLRVVVLSLYFGLAIVVERTRLVERPALAEQLDRLEDAEGRQAQVEMGERIRLRAVAHHHTVARRNRDRLDRLASRYLDAVVRDLDPDRHGQLGPLRDLLDLVATEGVEGDVAVVADGDPVPAALVRAHLAAHEDEGRTVWHLVVPPVDRSRAETALTGTLTHLELPTDVIVAATRAGLAPDVDLSPRVALLVDWGPGAGGRAGTLDPLRARLAPDGHTLVARVPPPRRGPTRRGPGRRRGRAGTAMRG